MDSLKNSVSDMKPNSTKFRILSIDFDKKRILTKQKCAVMLAVETTRVQQAPK